ncbi:MAG: formylglycine-generating enzyme family protein, partial [Desulfobacterales bacterium]|nr:formylglycine-generating enzyme family protein [Desulfobacterales bacterium]
LNVPPFYIDTTKVTAYHFSEFLNDVREKLIVESGVVKKSQEIWLYLGSGKEPFDQIIFEHDRFHLRNPEQGGLPIVRVTFYGARAYAKHYGKRLLTENEWRSAAGMQDEKINMKTVAPSNTEPSSMSHDQMMNLNTKNTVSASQDKSKIEQLKEGTNKTDLPIDMGIKTQEWVIASLTSQKDKADELDKNDKIISRVIGYSSGDPKLKLSLRYPWEGFTGVGFRTAVSLENIEHVE